MSDCDKELRCLCVSPEPVFVTSVAVAGTTATLTVNRDLTSLSFFRLHIPCAMIESILTTLDVAFTDGTNTYPGFNWLGNTLKISTLKKFFCRCRKEDEECGCERFLTCFDGNDPVHIEVLNRIV